MLLGNVRRDMHSDYRTNFNALLTPLSASSSTSTATRTSIASQQTMMNYARMPYRYTTVTLLSLRPPSEITIFPDHLVERRFLDEENYIDLDRMLSEKAGKFDLESFDMSDGPIMPRRIHKYDFSDPVVIQKVKNRRPKDPLTPQQVAALTSVATRHQSSTLLFPYQTPTSHVWIDDYSHQQSEMNSFQHHSPPQPSMPYQRQNPNQCEIYTNQIKSLLPTIEQKTDDTIPILQRLFEAQRLQQTEQRKIDSSSGHYQQGLSTLYTPGTPQQTHSNKSFEWIFSSNEKQKDVFSQLINEHLKCSTAMETPVTPSMNKEGNDEQKFYSTPSSPAQQQDNSLSLLENWFGTSIHKKSYPRMPSDRVLSACDLEQ